MATPPLPPSIQRYEVLESGIRDNKVKTGYGETALELRKIFISTDAHFRSPVTRSSLRQKFDVLALTWQRDTEVSSSISAISSHPAYLRIMGMGEPALPFIFEKLQQQPGHWFTALQAITGINAVKKENRGNMSAMSGDWIEWGRRHGYVNSPAKGFIS